MARLSKENPDPIDIELGKLLRLARNSCGMTQQDLGKRAGVTFQQIQKYEIGENRISVSRLFHMAESMNMPISWFVEKICNSRVTKKATIENLEALSIKGAKDILRAYGKITNRNERRFLLLVAVLLADHSVRPSSESGFLGIF